MLPALYTLPPLRFRLARNTRAYTSARSIGFCVIWVWVCIGSSSEFEFEFAVGSRVPSSSSVVRVRYSSSEGGYEFRV